MCDVQSGLEASQKLIFFDNHGFRITCMHFSGSGLLRAHCVLMGASLVIKMIFLEV